MEDVVDFWDEKLGHEVWHLGIFGLQTLLVWCGKSEPNVNTLWDVFQIFGLYFLIDFPLKKIILYSFSLSLGAAFIYGGILFAAIIEGGTPHIGIPYVIFIITLFLYVTFGYLFFFMSPTPHLSYSSIHKLESIRRQAILLYFFLATWIAALFCLWWGSVNHWSFPEFSKVGFLFPKQ